MQYNSKSKFVLQLCYIILLIDITTTIDKRLALTSKSPYIGELYYELGLGFSAGALWIYLQNVRRGAMRPTGACYTLTLISKTHLPFLYLILVCSLS